MGGTTLFSIFVGNLNPATTESELVNLFNKFGEAKRAFIAAKHSSFTYGFVKKENAKRAVEEMNGFVYKGRTLVVEISSESRYCVEITQEINEKKRGLVTKDRAIDVDPNVGKLLKLKIAIKKHNLSAGGPEIDCPTLLYELSKISTRLPTSIEDSFVFDGGSYLSGLKDARNDVDKRENCWMTPLNQSADMKELAPQWLPVSKKENATTRNTQSKDTASTQKMISQPRENSTEVAPPAVSKSRGNYRTNTIRKPNSQPLVGNMPDLVTDHQLSSSTSGYTSASSSAEESTTKHCDRVISLPKIETPYKPSARIPLLKNNHIQNQMPRMQPLNLNDVAVPKLYDRQVMQPSTVIHTAAADMQLSALTACLQAAHISARHSNYTQPSVVQQRLALQRLPVNISPSRSQQLPHGGYYTTVMPTRHSRQPGSGAHEKPAAHSHGDGRAQDLGISGRRPRVSASGRGKSLLVGLQD